MGNKPVLTASLIVAAFLSLNGVGASFGHGLGGDQAKSISESIPVVWVLGFAVYYWIKGGVTPNTEVAALKQASYAGGRDYERRVMQLHAAGATYIGNDGQPTADAVAAILRYCPPTMIAPTSPAASVVPAGPVDGGSPAHAAAIVS